MAAMSHKKIRLVFVGAGTMGQAAHLRNYAALRDDCEIVALSELRPRLAQAIAAKFAIPRVYHDAAEMLAREQPDAIIASQPFTRHGLLVQELAKTGRPIFMEKPVAGSIEVAEQIVATLARHGTWAMVGYHKRSDLAVEWAMREIGRLRGDGELGALRYVRITMPPGDWIAGGFDENLNTGEPRPSLPKDPKPQDLVDVAAKDYETFVNYYIHQINLMRHLVGEPCRVSYADPAGILLVAHSATGVPCSIEMAPYTTDRDWHETALVAFERGFIRLSLPAPLVLGRAGEVEIFRNPGKDIEASSLRPVLSPVHAMRNQALNFIRAVRGEAPAPCLASDAVEDLRLARDYIRLLKGA